MTLHDINRHNLKSRKRWPRSVAEIFADRDVFRGLLALEAGEVEEAEIAFQQARSAVDDLLTKVSEDTLLNQPGMQPVRKELLEKALSYYRRFLEQHATDPKVKAELAATALSVMERHSITHLLITGEDDRLDGVIRLQDILRAKIV